MASDADRDLRRLAKRYRITFRPNVSSDQWPSKHKQTFSNIQVIGSQKFNSYCTNVDIRSSEQPWREQTKHRAKWLAERCARLLSQQRNEAGWRFGLENDVLRRFMVEVACPKCRARIWRSEIEAYMNQSGDDAARRLEEQRSNRKPCKCPPGIRAQDYYEIGTNPLFDDRVQEVILHEPLLRSELPKQEPDRVYGLQATQNFEDLLSSSMANTSPDDQGYSVGECIRTSPFKEGAEPLLFPFLVLEAKAEKSSNGFVDIQTQTMFPVRALLKLQEDLQLEMLKSQQDLRDEMVDTTENDLGPLVWFFANRGDSWRVYGCYVTDDQPPHYYPASQEADCIQDIVQLWDGCILSKDGALQLLLIVDYIFDWARDIYRPSILRQLKSLATGRAFDQISLTDESGIFSLRNYVSTWMQPPPSTLYGTEAQAGYTQATEGLDHQGRRSKLMPNTKLGTLRSTSEVHSRVIGLYLDERSARFWFELARVTKLGSDTSQSETRWLINFVTQWNDLIVLTERDLGSLEELWTGNFRQEDEASTPNQDAEVYTLVEFASYMSPTWEIVRELIYLAISKPAFDILVQTAAYSKKHHGIHALPEIIRPCDHHVLNDAINCLHSGSPSQILLAAVTCSAFALYSLPGRQRPDYIPPTEDLGFGRIRHSRLRDVVSKFQRIVESTRSKKRPKTHMSARKAAWHNAKPAVRALEEREGIFPEYKDVNLIRITESQDDVSLERPHEVDHCPRCRRLSQSTEGATQVREAGHMSFSADGVAIVESLNLKDYKHALHDVCLLTASDFEGVEDQIAMAELARTLLQSGNIYHTLRYPIPDHFYSKIGDRGLLWRDTAWNLPLPLRPPTNDQHRDISNWISELRGEPIAGQDRSRYDMKESWNTYQLSMYFLNKGLTWEAVTQKIGECELGTGSGVFEAPGDRYDMYKRLDREEIAARKAAGQSEALDWHGMRDSAHKLRIGDGDIRNYHGTKWPTSLL